MYYAEMWSESLIWKSIGGTEEEAKNAILNEWNYRQKKMHNDGHIPAAHLCESVEDLEVWYDIEVTHISRGQCVVK